MYKNITKKEIEREYVDKQGMKGREAAKNLGITYKTFTKKLVEFGIKKKKRVSKYPELNNKEWVKDQYFVQKKSVKEIATKIGATDGAVYSAIRWAGFDLRSSKEGLLIRYPHGRYAENASNWKGGHRNGGKDGRYDMLYTPTHPKADSSGYVMKHRLVMEKKLGRYLTKEEIIHHKDGDGHNNKISNLELTTRKKHFKNHFEGVKSVKKYKDENIRLKKLLKYNNIDF